MPIAENSETNTPAHHKAGSCRRKECGAENKSAAVLLRCSRVPICDHNNTGSSHTSGSRFIFPLLGATSGMKLISAIRPYTGLGTPRSIKRSSARRMPIN